MSRARLHAIVAAAAVAAAACAPHHHADGEHVTANDARRPVTTARGTVTVVGSEPQTAVVLASPAGAAAIALVGEGAALLAPLAGVDVEVEGAHVATPAPAATPPGTTVLEVRDFTVVAVNGVAAHDGVLEHDGRGYHLRIRDGTRVALPALPSSLRGHVGARIYLVGPLDRAPALYGIIAPAGGGR